MMKLLHSNKKLQKWVINFNLLLLLVFILKILQSLNLLKNIEKKVWLHTLEFNNKNLLEKKMVILVLNTKEKLVHLILMQYQILSVAVKAQLQQWLDLQSQNSFKKITSLSIFF